MRCARPVVLLALAAAPLLAAACTHDDKSQAGASGSGSASASTVASADPLGSASGAANAGAASASGSAASAVVDAGPPILARRAGVAGLLLRSALELDGVTDAQKDAIAKLAAPLDTDDVRGAYQSFRGDLLAGIKAGAIDKTKAQADDAAVDKAVAAQQQKQADAINGLHAALDGATRKALTAALRAKQVAHEERPPVGLPDAGAADWQKRRVDRLTRELGLDDGQQKQVTALVAKSELVTPTMMWARREDLRKRTDAMFTGFEQDTFDAKKFDLTMTPGKKPHEALDRQVSFYGGLLGVLKPEQTAKLGARMDHPPFPTHPGVRNEPGLDPGVDEFDMVP
jgi:hypothetical protein